MHVCELNAENCELHHCGTIRELAYFINPIPGNNVTTVPQSTLMQVQNFYFYLFVCEQFKQLRGSLLMQI